jgi:hypothetical protein
MISGISKRQILIRKDFTRTLTERICRSPTVPSHCPRYIPNGVQKQAETIPGPNSEWIHQIRTKWLLTWQLLIIQCNQVRWRQRSWLRMRQSYYSNDDHWEMVQIDSSECQSKKCQDLGNVAFWEQMHTWFMMSMTTNWNAYILDMNQWHTAYTRHN